jgi:lipoprotein NlpI
MNVARASYRLSVFWRVFFVTLGSVTLGDEPKEMFKFYDVAIENKPDDAAACFHRGVTEDDNADYNRAIDDFSKAIDLNPNYVEAYRNRGIAKADIGDFAGAMADCNKAIELNPHYALAYRSRGFLRYNLFKYADALADFRKFCELDSKTSQDYPRFRIWLIRARSGEMGLATAELQNYLQYRKALEPEDWPIKIAYFLTDQLSEPDLFKAAENRDKKRNDDQHCEAWFFAGSKRLIEGDKTTAADYFTKCLATNAKVFQDYKSAAAELKYLQATNTRQPIQQLNQSETNQTRARTIQQALKQAHALLPSALQAYDQQFGSAISYKWYSLLHAKAFPSPDDGNIVATFKLHRDGSVSDIEISGNSNSPIAPFCVQAIMDCSPFPKWPDKMHPVAGQDYRKIKFTFYVNQQLQKR